MGFYIGSGVDGGSGADSGVDVLGVEACTFGRHCFGGDGGDGGGGNQSTVRVVLGGSGGEL